MKYLHFSSVLSLFVIVALRVPVLVKPEPRLDEVRVHFVGSAGEVECLKDWLWGWYHGAVVSLMLVVLEEVEYWRLILEDCQHTLGKRTVLKPVPVMMAFVPHKMG